MSQVVVQNDNIFILNIKCRPTFCFLIRPSVILPYDLIDGLVIEGKKPAESSVVEPPDEVVLERRPTRPRLNLSETEDMSSLSPSEEKDEKLSKFPTLPDSMIGEDNVEHRRVCMD